VPVNYCYFIVHVQIQPKLTMGGVLPVSTPVRHMECRRTNLSLYSYLYHYNCISVIGCLHKQLRERGVDVFSAMLGRVRMGEFFLLQWRNIRGVWLILGCAYAGERNATFSHFPHYVVLSVCALHKHDAFSSSHVLRPYRSRNLDVAWRPYNYRLSRAQKKNVACEFVILWNKWRVFRRAMGVHPDLCDVIVKSCCIAHSCVCQTDDLPRQDSLYECSLQSVKAVGTGFNTRCDPNVLRQLL
jgi:hypothetical protein